MSKWTAGEDQQCTCGICQDEDSPDPNLARTFFELECNHGDANNPLHAACIFKWVEQAGGAATCPICRTLISDGDRDAIRAIAKHNKGD